MAQAGADADPNTLRQILLPGLPPILLHNTALMSLRPTATLAVAFALSLALHAAPLLPGLWPRPAAPPLRPVLRAELRPPALPAPVAPAESLLKNTLDVEAEKPLPPPSPAPAPEIRRPAANKARAPQVAKREVRSAQKKLAQHLYYPPEAVARGLEGEVRLLVTLGADGGIADVRVAASSGYPLLDNAAAKAAWAMGRAEASGRELLLPVIFRLQ